LEPLRRKLGIIGVTPFGWKTFCGIFGVLEFFTAVYMGLDWSPLKRGLQGTILSGFLGDLRAFKVFGGQFSYQRVLEFLCWP